MLLTILEQDQKNISRETGILLSFLTKGSILEIGTNHGYSTYWLSLNAKNVISYEIRKDRFEQAKKNLKELKRNNIILKNENFLKNNIKEKFDLIFIDGTKKEYIDYFKKAEKLIKKNGLIICDNVISHKEKMLDFLDYIKKFKNKLTLNINKGILIIKF
ncbi:class I SAM-dependent methyltransferase [Candidatus Woesearchaeota archaeon]|nr:class I SAM-dependent methyltransferase [Candidatus Woesearchaeota archaeon]